MQRLPPLLLFSGSLVAWLSSIAWIAWLLPRLGVGSSGSFFWTCVLLGVAIFATALWFHYRRQGEGDQCESDGVGGAGLTRIAILVAPAIGLVDMLRILLLSGGHPRVGMNGDAVWNTAQALFLHSEGGVVSGDHANPAPLTNALMALSYGPDALPSLGTVFTGNWLVFTFLAVAASYVGGKYVARATTGAPTLMRTLLILVVGWVPFTGILMGTVISLGHFNVLLAYLLLWITWIVATEPSGHETRIILLTFCTTATAATWAPLLVVPLALLGWECFALLLALFRGAGHMSVGGWVAMAIALAQVIAYGLVVTLADFMHTSNALVADGAVQSLSFVSAGFGVIFMTVSLGALFRLAPHGGLHLRVLKSAVILCILIVVTALLMKQRSGLENLWGYYPAKYFTLLGTWLSAIILILSSKIGTKYAPTWKQWATMAVAVPAFALMVIGPWWPWVTFSIWPAAIAQRGVQEDDIQSISDMVAVFDENPGGASLMLDWGDPKQDSLANNYLIQLSATSSSDPIRQFAYFYDYSDHSLLCPLLTQWDRPVTIYSQPGSVEGLRSIVDSCPLICPVDFRTEAPPVG